MKRFTRLLIGSSLAVLTLAACTKEIPYEEKLKVEVLDRSAIDNKSEYLMSSSMLNASRSSQDALPFSMGDNKRVKFEWTKTSLRVLEMESDARFKDNATNNKLVMEIPVEYVDYQCAKDKYGECTNSEQVREDIPWEQMTKFKFKPEAAKSSRLETLPLLLDRELSGGFCYEETSARVIDLKVEKDALNMSIERTFKLNIFCMSQMEKLSDTTVSAVFHYSMVKTSSVLSPGFKTVNYPRVDEGAFGFFTTDSQELDSDNNATTRGQKTIMNHWNPNRKSIDYYLSKEFSKPEHAKIRELSYKVVGALNDGLAKSEANFRINLHDGKDMNPGDIRNSMIVLVEDPVASSIIGYGPQTEDPVTGEIISARTVMFLGTIKKFVKYTYDDIIREKRAEKLKIVEEPKKDDKPDAPKEEEDNGGLIIEDGKIARMTNLKAALGKSVYKAPSQFALMTKRQNKTKSASANAAQATGLNAAKVAQIMSEVKAYKKEENTDYHGGIHARLKYLQEAKNCAYGLNSEDLMANSINPEIAAQIPDDAKPWDQLSESEKQAVIDLLLPEVWVPTLIHEMGHNLGLRHNFQGSEDPANFYTEKELQAFGINHKIPFSTVMEYGDDLKALPVLGKYDIAALRFAYGKKVELEDGTLVPVQNTIKETLENLNREEKDEKGQTKAKTVAKLKDYGYCTDEHTGINAGCRRFDLGTTYTEIIQNEIQTYLNSYHTANFRNGRASMSLADDPSYASRVRSRFMGMRLMQEIYERMQTIYPTLLSDGNPNWDAYPDLKDIKDASTLAGDFLASVVATPDLTCVLAPVANDKQIAGVERLDKLTLTKKISCYDVTSDDLAQIGLGAYKVIGQYGKLFQSRKDPKSDNPYADQIDVRGYWLDKLMASRILFARTLGISILDKATNSYADRLDHRQQLLDLTQGLVLNQVSGPQVVEFVDGSMQVMNLPVDMDLVVEKPLYSEIAQSLGVPDETVPFSQVYIDTLNKRLVDASHKQSGNTFLDVIRVASTHLGDKWEGNFNVLDVSNVRYIATPSNTVANQLMSAYPASATLEAVELQENGQARLIELYRAKAAKQPEPAGLNAAEKAVWALEADVIADYLNGVMLKPDALANLLSILPNSIQTPALSKK